MWDSEPEQLYTIGQDSRWKSLRLKGKERNLTAFNNELLSLIASEENFQVRLISTINPFEDLFEGKVDAILSVMHPKKSTGNFYYSDAYFLTGPVLIVPTRPETKQEEEREVKIMAIPQNSPLLPSLEMDPTSQVKIYDDILDALKDLKSKKIDGAIFPAIPSYYYVDVYFSSDLKVATMPLTDDGIRLYAAKNDKGKALIEKFNKGLKETKENESYLILLETWGLFNTERTP